MDESSSQAWQAFERHVRDALRHLYDPASLQTHPLLRVMGEGEDNAASPAQRLRRSLLDAIEAVHPDSGTSSERSWRLYRILEMRYIEGREVNDVIDQVALSKSQYHREHDRALRAVSAEIWDRWKLGETWMASGGDLAYRTEGIGDATRLEVDHLIADNRTQRVDPVEVVRGVGAILQPLCRQRGVTLEPIIGGDVPAIRGERIALRHAVLAILASAIATVALDTVRVEVREQGANVEVCIEGDSPGPVSPEQLGIATSRPFVAALNGVIHMDLPTATWDSWSVRLSFPAGDPPTLLVVDNNPGFISLVERYLAGHGWAVVGASTTQEAYSLVQDRLPRAILLDVVIPGRDGWDFLLDLRGTPKLHDIPVIVCSVLAEPGVAASLGAAGYLQKPVHQNQLVEALRRFA